MLSWLASIGKILLGDINAVKNWVIRAVAAVYTWLEARVTWLATWISDVEKWAASAINSTIRFINTVYSYAVHLGTVVLRDIYNVLAAAINAAENLIRWVYHELLTGIDTLEKWAVAAFNATRRWVLTEIWNPLFRLMSGAILWIERDGYFLYDLVTHPEKLTAYIGHWLWVTWLDLLRKYSRPVAKWLFGHMLGYAVEFAHIVESVITDLV